MDLLMNPWVIIIIVVSVIVGNIMVLKYTANMKFGQMQKKKPPTTEDDQPDDKS